MCDYDFYVLTMRDPCRIKSIERQLSKLSVTANYIDGIVYSPENCNDQDLVNEAEVLKRNSRKLTRGEVGCVLSHRGLWERVVASGKPSVILEDDAIIDLRLLEFLKQLDDSGDSFDVVLLGHSKKSYRARRLYHFLEPLKVKVKVGGFWLGRGFKTWSSGAVGYVITPKGAKNILNISHSINSVLDDWPYYEEKGVLVKEVRPLLVWEDYVNLESSLEKERQSPARNKMYFLARIARGCMRNVVSRVRN